MQWLTDDGWTKPDKATSGGGKANMGVTRWIRVSVMCDVKGEAFQLKIHTCVSPPCTNIRPRSSCYIAC